MIPNKPAPHLIQGGYRFSEKIMLKQRSRAGWRFEEKSSRSSLSAPTPSRPLRRLKVEHLACPATFPRYRIMDPNPAHANEDLWVFAYGSLMWRPDFPFVERIEARLLGAKPVSLRQNFVNKLRSASP